MPNHNNNAIEQQASNDYGGKRFDFGMNIDEMKPEAYAGKYEFRFGKAIWKWTNSHPSRPMIVLEVKLIETYEDSAECKSSVMVELLDYIVLDDSSRGNQGKAKLRALRDKLELTVDFSRMTPETVEQFAEEVYGRELTGWVTNRKQADGVVRCNIEYNEPRGRIQAPTPRREEPEAIEDEPVEEEPDLEEPPKVKHKGPGPAKASRR